ncbi:BnaA03g60710D, partial [Brassica napus]
ILILVLSQSLQQLLPGAFDEDDYDEWKNAETLFLGFFFWTTHFSWSTKCLNTFKELIFWLMVLNSVEHHQMRTVEYIAKCKTVRHTTKSTRLECTIWF